MRSVQGAGLDEGHALTGTERLQYRLGVIGLQQITHHRKFAPLSHRGRCPPLDCHSDTAASVHHEFYLSHRNIGALGRRGGVSMSYVLLGHHGKHHIHVRLALATFKLCFFTDIPAAHQTDSIGWIPPWA